MGDREREMVEPSNVVISSASVASSSSAIRRAIYQNDFHENPSDTRIFYPKPHDGAREKDRITKVIRIDPQGNRG